MNNIVIYHGLCYDGLTSAWIAWTKFKTYATYIAGFYGNPIPVIESPSTIYLLDFSYSDDIIQSWLDAGNQVIILDHHESAIQSLTNLVERNKNNKNFTPVLDNNRSGAGITWDWFNSDKSRPSIVKYVQDRDLWKFEYKNLSRFLYSYMQLRIEFNSPLTQQFEIMDMINETLETSPNVILDKGQVLSESYYKFCRGFADHRTLIKTDSFPSILIPVITTNKYFGSDTCSYINKELGYPISGYFFLEKANQWSWGFRSISSEFDVSKLCQKYGGGGHKSAAGFVLKSPSPFPSDWEIVEE